MAYDAFTLKQNRFSETDTSGNITYRIDISCTNVRNPSAVTVLTPDVFVYSTDTTIEADTSSGGSIDGHFLRVATIADLSQVPVGLEDALASGKTSFRSRSLQLSMPDLETALNAVPIIVDRVNTLIVAYIKYQEDFFTDVDFKYSLPRATDLSVVATYSNAYANAVSARKSGEEAVALSTKERQLLQIKSELLMAYRDELEGYRDSLLPVQTELAALATATSDGAIAIDKINSIIPKSFKLMSLYSLLVALCSNRRTLLTTNSAQEGILLSQLKEKEEELASLQSIENSALADLAVYCPQIDATQLS